MGNPTYDPILLYWPAPGMVQASISPTTCLTQRELDLLQQVRIEAKAVAMNSDGLDSELDAMRRYIRIYERINKW